MSISIHIVHPILMSSIQSLIYFCEYEYDDVLLILRSSSSNIDLQNGEKEWSQLNENEHATEHDKFVPSAVACINTRQPAMETKVSINSGQGNF